MDTIYCDGLVKRYGKRTVADNISLRIAPGTFYAFLGPNGAGKSTVIRCLTGLTAPSEGIVRVAGKDVVTETLAVKANIGVVSDDVALYEKLSAGEFLEWAGRLRGLTAQESSTRANDLLTLLELSGDADRQIAEYSLGMKKKTALAFALLHAPSVLFLDEPFNGVDTLSARTLCTVLTELTRRGVTVFFTSHVLETVEKLAHRVGVIHQGSLIAEGTVDEIKARATGSGSGSLEDAFTSLIGANKAITPSTSSLAWYQSTGFQVSSGRI